MEDFSSFSIMVVDDEKDVREVLSGQLNILGFPTVIMADDGDKAIEMLATTPVDLIICDWAMPNMNGTGVLKFIRSHPILKNTPFIMYSGYVPEEVIAEAAETEVDAYMVKPFTMEELREKITKVVNANIKQSAFERHLAAGKAYRMTTNYGKAIPELKKALERRPKSPRALLELGLCCEAQADSLQARRYFEKAIKLAPKYIKAHEAIAKQYYKEGNTVKYLNHLENMLQINPRNIERNIAIGKTMAQCGRVEEAKKILLKTMDLASQQHADIAEKVGDVFLDIGSPDLAEETFSKALLANPKSTFSVNRLGILYRQQGEHQKAIDTYKKGLEVAPDNENMMHNLAVAYYECGDKGAAIDVLKKALEVNPDFDEAKELLNAYIKLSGSDDHKEIIKEVL